MVVRRYEKRALARELRRKSIPKQVDERSRQLGDVDPKNLNYPQEKTSSRNLKISQGRGGGAGGGGVLHGSLESSLMLDSAVLEAVACWNRERLRGTRT